MALSKEALLKLLNNPGKFNPSEDGEMDETIQGNTARLDDEENNLEQSAKDEALINSIRNDSDLNREFRDSIYNKSVDIDDAKDDLEKQKEALKPAQNMSIEPQAPDEEVLAAIKKLRNKQNGVEDEEPSADVVSDTSAPMEMRKKAIQQIKQKYLGTK